MAEPASHEREDKWMVYNVADMIRKIYTSALLV